MCASSAFKAATVLGGSGGSSSDRLTVAVRPRPVARIADTLDPRSRTTATTMVTNATHRQTDAPEGGTATEAAAIARGSRPSVAVRRDDDLVWIPTRTASDWSRAFWATVIK